MKKLTVIIKVGYDPTDEEFKDMNEDEIINQLIENGEFEIEKVE